MGSIHLLYPGLQIDDIWRNYHYLEQRLAKLEAKVRELEACNKHAKETSNGHTAA